MASLADIVKGVQETNNLLMTNVEAQKRVNQMMIDSQRDADAAKMDALAASKKTMSRPAGGKSGMPKGFGAGFKQGMGGGLIGGIISSLFAAGSGLLGVITGGIGLALGTLVLPLAAIALIAKFGEGLVLKLLEGLDPNNVVLDDESKKIFAQGAVKSLVIGIGLAILSKPLGIAVFLAGLIVSAFKAGMTPDQRASFEKDIFDGALKKFGITFSKENMMWIGSTIAGLVGFGMIKRLLIGSIFGGGGPKGAAKSGKIFGFLRAGFLLKASAGMILGAMGEALGDAVATITGSQALGNMVTGAAGGAALAMMLGLGPQGILFAAIIGVAAAGLTALGLFMQKRRSEYIDAINKEMEQELNKTEGYSAEELNNYYIGLDAKAKGKLANLLMTSSRQGNLLDAGMGGGQYTAELGRKLANAPGALGKLGADFVSAHQVQTTDASGPTTQMETMLSYLTRNQRTDKKTGGPLLDPELLFASGIMGSQNLGVGGVKLREKLNKSQLALIELLGRYYQVDNQSPGAMGGVQSFVDTSQHQSTAVTTVISGGNGLNTKDNYVQNSNGDIFSGSVLWDGR